MQPGLDLNLSQFNHLKDRNYRYIPRSRSRGLPCKLSPDKLQTDSSLNDKALGLRTAGYE